MTKSVRNLWLGPHLLQEESGAAAHRAAEDLGQAAHESILAIGDRLAESSALLAQCYYRNAAQAWQSFGG